MENQILKELESIYNKIDKLSKSDNKVKADFWTIIKTRLNNNIIDYIKRDKRLYGW